MNSFLSITIRFYIQWIIYIIIAAIVLYIADIIFLDTELIELLILFTTMVVFGLTNIKVSDQINQMLDQTKAANNINNCEHQDETTFPDDAKQILPIYRGLTYEGKNVTGNSGKKKIQSKNIYYGQLEDLGISFYFEYLSYKNDITYKLQTKDEKVTTNMGYSGDMLIIDDPNIDFGQEWIIFESNKHLRCPADVPVRNNEYLLENCQGRVYFGDNSSIDHQRIIDYFETNSQLFDGEKNLIVLLRGSQLIYCYPNVADKPLICSPFWTPKKVEKKFNQSKRSIYLLNQLLVDISRSFNQLKKS